MTRSLGPDALERKRARYRANIDEERRKARERRARNVDRARAGARSWYRANRDYAIAYAQARRQRPEVKAAHAARMRARPALRREIEARRRARRRGASILPITAAGLRARWLYYGGRCWLCGVVADTWDHVKPLAAGGAHALCNLRPACGPCNSKKRDKWPL